MCAVFDLSGLEHGAGNSSDLVNDLLQPIAQVISNTTALNFNCGRGADSNATTCHIDVLLSRTRVTFRVSICTPTTVVSPVVSTTAHNVCREHEPV